MPKANISAPIAHLSASKMKAAAGAIGFALGIVDSQRRWGRASFDRARVVPFASNVH
jgi:hypothetical protein